VTLKWYYRTTRELHAQKRLAWLNRDDNESPTWFASVLRRMLLDRDRRSQQHGELTSLIRNNRNLHSRSSRVRAKTVKARYRTDITKLLLLRSALSSVIRERNVLYIRPECTVNPHFTGKYTFPHKAWLIVEECSRAQPRMGKIAI